MIHLFFRTYLSTLSLQTPFHSENFNIIGFTFCNSIDKAFTYLTPILQGTRKIAHRPQRPMGYYCFDLAFLFNPPNISDSYSEDPSSLSNH